MGIISKRPVVSFCIMMIIGILTAYLSDSIAAAVSAFILLSACFYSFSKLHKNGMFVPFGMLVFFLLGSLEFLYVDRLQLNRFTVYAGKDVAIRGHILSEPEIRGERVSYIVKAESIRKEYNGSFEKVNGKVLLTTIIGEDGSFLDYGRELEFEGILTQPKGVRNPGGFDYRRYLAQKGVGASVFSYAYGIDPGEEIKGNFLVQAGLKIRKRIVYVIEKSLPHQQAGLLNGMLIGYTEGLSEEVQEAFSNAGLSHIMAVSGANVAFLILPLAFLLKLLRVRKQISNVLLIAFLTLFVFVTGLEPSVLRAAIMASVLLIAQILYREPDTYSAIAVSCIILLAVNPCMLFHIGFQLSYGATLSIVMLYKNIRNLITVRSQKKPEQLGKDLIQGKDKPKPIIPGWIADILAATLAAQLGVLPVTVLYFNKISLVAILTNLLAVPMLELITILGSVMALLGQFSLAISQMIGYLNSVLLSAVLYITKFANNIPFATVTVVTPPLILAAAYYVSIWFMLWYKPLKNIAIKRRHIAAALSAAAVFVLATSLKPAQLEVVFLDVGQGDSSFIRTTSGETVLIDGGGSSSPDKSSKIGESVILPFLLDAGAGRLGAVIATHPHSDHTQGLYDVLMKMKVGRLILPYLNDESGFAALIQAAGERNIPVFRCSANDVIRLDEKTYLKVLNPEADWQADEDSLNNASFVLKLCYGQTSVLFTGDAETEVEEKLLANAFPVSGDAISATSQDGASLLKADVIKIAHHGSISSTGKVFLEKVSPQAAIISVGKNNFGHPSQMTLDLLEQCKVKCFRTDECGAVILESNGRTVRLKRTVRY
ncbi:MAG: DNA internalization-related competence protein ComEC/Rec2 [Clostridiaceae bacterium]